MLQGKFGIKIKICSKIIFEKIEVTVGKREIQVTRKKSKLTAFSRRSYTGMETDVISW